MKRFIRYLYEYKQGKRLRNVGFVKVEQEETECAVHIHGKGLHMNGEKKLDLYLFYEEEKECTGIWQGTVDNVNPAINYRLHYTKEDVGAPENFPRINGIILESDTGRRYAAVWDDMPVDVERMRMWQKRSESLEEWVMREIEREAKEPEDAGEPQEGEEQNTAELQIGEESGNGTESEKKEKSQTTKGLQTEEEQEEPIDKDILENAGENIGKTGILCAKIQRTDLAKLPRCEWKWANNNFLLHGYYNYHHLALLDDGKGLRLGVPGIYHPQEAKAAAALGFGEFMPVQDIRVELAEEERNTQEPFGYWCRHVKGQMPDG